MAVPCCFCMKEFPVWTNAVTSHINSHVKIQSVRCVECCLSFISKETLMSHLHSSHSRLPKSICIDVRIEKHERCHVQLELLSNTEAAVADEALCTETQRDGAEETRHIGNVVKNESADKNEEDRMVGTDDVMGLDRCVSTNDTDVESSTSCSVETSISSVLHTDNNVKSSADSPTKKTGRRKSRGPSYDVDDTRCSELPDETNSDCVDIVAATQPMTAQCSHCTFSCNTEVHLKV